MKKILSVIWLVLFLLVVPHVRAAGVVPIEIWSDTYNGTFCQPWPLFSTEDWTDVKAYYECKGVGHLIFKTRLLNSHGKVVEKWEYDFGQFDCTDGGTLWMIQECFMPQEAGRYKAVFIYTFQGVTRRHATRIYFVDITEEDE